MSKVTDDRTSTDTPDSVNDHLGVDSHPDLMEPLGRSIEQAVEHAEDSETKYHLRHALQLIEILHRR